ncbi:DUF2478 domain-containing protein [Bradyrhizobium sp. BRP56]|nr:DUF2478 domain-containing protein [Bradyrhizobium sp. BRP56]
MRGDFTYAVVRGAPLLTVISVRCLTAGQTFTGDFCTLLPYVYQVAKHWLCDGSPRV